MPSKLENWARTIALNALNRKVCAPNAGERHADYMASFIVVTPHLVHLAPLAALNHGPHIVPTFVANGIDQNDIAWLKTICPQVPVVHMRTSLSGNSASLLAHGDIIDSLAHGRNFPFCIQDADCFITEPSFWETVTLAPAKEFASGPYLRQGTQDRPDFPETFLLCLNGDLMAKLRRRYGIGAATQQCASGRAKHILSEAGYPEGRYLETLKNYYDTLQQYWVIARHQGFTFRHIDGEDKAVHHIGGTSYLFRTLDDLAHWDYWPLNVHYLNLKLLEFPACHRFRDRFQSIINHHQSSGNLLNTYPDFRNGWRRELSDRILMKLDAEGFYGERAS